MNFNTKRGKRVLAGTAAIAVASSLAAISPIGVADAAVRADRDLTFTASAPLDQDSTFNLDYDGDVTDFNCAGDGEAGYTISGFVVPNGTDPASLSWSGAVPGGSGYVAPLIAGGAIYGGIAPGLGDGFVSFNTTEFTFNHPAYRSAFSFPGAGEYEIGIACVQGGATSEYWSANFTVTGTADAWTWTEGLAPAAPAAPTGVAATPQDGALSVSWDVAADADSYNLQVSGGDLGSPIDQTGVTPPVVVSGLTNDTTYDVQVTAVNAQGSTSTTVQGTPTSGPPPPPPETVVVQNITVTVPEGALVLTQDCGLALCDIDLGTAALAANGQNWRATGAIDRLTVTDTRAVDAGWSLTAQMDDFSDGAGGTFSGDALGLNVTANDADPDPLTGYDQTVTTTDVAAGVPGGLSDGETIATAAAGAGLGVARVNAGIVLLIPLTADPGTYSGELTFTVA